MKNQSIGFIGGGRVTRIFLHAFKNSNVTLGKIAVYDPNTDSLVKLKKSFGGIVCQSDNQGINPVVFSEMVNYEQKNNLTELLLILGKAPIVPEQKIEAYAMINASVNTLFYNK